MRKRSQPSPQTGRRMKRNVLGLAITVVVFGCWAGAIAAFLPWAVPGAMTGIGVIAGGIWCLHRERALLYAARAQLAAQSTMEEAREHSLQVMRKIMSFVEQRDPHWRGHSENVGELAAKIACKLGLSDETCDRLVLAGELHDIGMLGIADAMTSRKFGCDEFRRMSRHSEMSCELILPLVQDETVLRAIRHHHERMNGTGYPGKLVGEAIPIEARILAIADTYDAMTHDRPQRRAMTNQQAMNELRRCSPAGYDPNCVEALAEILHMDVHDSVGPVAAGRMAIGA